jgi:hypothetical protein
MQSALSDLEITKSTPMVDATFWPVSGYNVQKPTFVPGNACFKTDAVAIPVIRGIAISSSMRSGFNFPAFSIASTPSAASPQTRSSREVSSTIRSAVRIIAWSSTIKTSLRTTDRPFRAQGISDGGRSVSSDNQFFRVSDRRNYTTVSEVDLFNRVGLPAKLDVQGLRV